MQIRRALPADSHLIWKWRNDPHTRKMFKTSDVIPWESHSKWFEGSLASPTRRLYVGVVDNDPIGMVRFDLEEFAETSINLAPEHRGKGYSVPLLALAVKVLEDEFGPLKEATDVKPENAASLKCFSGAGYRDVGTIDGFVRMVRDLRL